MPMAGRTCLLLFLSILAGCSDTRSKLDAGDRSAAHDQPSAKPSESSSAKPVATLPVRSPDDQLGFHATWKPKPTPAKTSAAEPMAAGHRGAEDNRYVELPPAPAFGNQVDSPRRSDQRLDAPQSATAKAAEPSAMAVGGMAKAAEDAPSAIPVVPGSNAAPDPATIGPAIAAPPAGNPLRDPDAAPVTGRPEDLPQPVLPPSPPLWRPQDRQPGLTLRRRRSSDQNWSSRIRPNRRSPRNLPRRRRPLPPSSRRSRRRRRRCGAGQARPAYEQEQRRALRSDQGERQDLRRLAQAQAGAGVYRQPGGLPGAVRLRGS